MSQPTSKCRYRRTEHMFYADIVMDNVAVDLFTVRWQKISKWQTRDTCMIFFLNITYNCVW